MKPTERDSQFASSAGGPDPDGAESPVSVERSESAPDWSGAGLASGSIFADPRWGEIMRRVYGNRPWYLTARSGGRTVGTLLLVEKRSILFTSHLCSVPYFDAVGVSAQDEPTRDALLREAAALRDERRVEYVELRQAQPLGDDLPTRTDKVTLQLDVPDDFDRLWKDLNAKVRNQVRRPQKAGMQCECGGPELLGAFHRIYARNMRDLGSPPHALRFFKRIAETFGSRVRVYVVRQEGVSVAASLTLSDDQAVHVPWAGSDWRYRKSCPNYLLYWSMLRDTCGRAKRFDFGRSTRDAGTYKFKRQWGAEEVPLYWHYLTRNNAPPAEPRPDSGVYGYLTACWKRLPLWAAKAMGPRIIGKLS